MGDRRQCDGRASRHQKLPAAHPRPRRRRPYRQHRIDGGMEGGLGFSPYAASKFAVVSMSEGLSLQLKPFGIGVSVLCPSFVRTRIGESGRNRPERYGQSQPLDPASPAAAIVAEIARQIEAGLDPATVAARVLEAIRQDELYIFTHPGMRAEVEPRFAAILAAMDKVSAP